MPPTGGQASACHNGAGDGGPCDPVREVLEAVSVWWVGVVLGVTLVLAGLFFIWRKRGTETAVGQLTVLGIPMKEVRGQALVVVLGAVLVWQSLGKLDDDDGVPVDRIAKGEVARIENEPSPPKPLPKGRDLALTYVRWLTEFLDHAHVVIDQGAKNGVRQRDVFVVVEDTERLKGLRTSQLGNLGDEELASLRVARAYEKESVAQLESFTYEPVLRRVPENQPERFFTDGAPARKGEAVVAVPRDERVLHDQIEEKSAEANQRTGLKKRAALKDVIERTTEFRDQFPEGFYSADALFEQGYAQWRLKQCSATARTFRRFVGLYPLHRSVGGARSYIKRAERCQRRRRASV